MHERVHRDLFLLSAALPFAQNCLLACFSLQFHNKVTCFMLHHIEEPCSLGAHAAVIVPPTWIIKVKKPQVTAGTLVLLGQCRGQVPAASAFLPLTSLGIPPISALVPTVPHLPSPVHPISPSAHHFTALGSLMEPASSSKEFKVPQQECFLPIPVFWVFSWGPLLTSSSTVEGTADSRTPLFSSSLGTPRE